MMSLERAPRCRAGRRLDRQRRLRTPQHARGQVHVLVRDRGQHVLERIRGTRAVPDPSEGGRRISACRTRAPATPPTIDRAGDRRLAVFVELRQRRGRRRQREQENRRIGGVRLLVRRRDGSRRAGAASGRSPPARPAPRRRCSGRARTARRSATARGSTCCRCPRSSRRPLSSAATVAAIVCGAVPGSVAVTVIVGKSTSWQVAHRQLLVRHGCRRRENFGDCDASVVMTARRMNRSVVSMR